MDLKPVLKKEDLVYYDECYKIVGLILAVHNELGYGYDEKTYQKALAESLRINGYHFIEQLYAPVMFGDKVVGRNYFDFLIENIIVVEIKKGDHFSTAHINQLYRYLVSKNLKLGILAYFAPRGVHYKRVVNLH